MKKFDVVCWAVIGLLLVFLWNSSSLEFFQDQVTDASGNKTMGPIRGPPYTAADAAAIVGMMPATMKAALNTRSGSNDPAMLIAPITPLFADFHSGVYGPATTPITTANVDTFLQTANIPTGVTKADVKTLMVAYFVNQRAGDANLALTSAQTAANARQTRNATASVANAAAYAAQLAGLGQTGGYQSANAAQASTGQTSQASTGQTSQASTADDVLSPPPQCPSRRPFVPGKGCVGSNGKTSKPMCFDNAPYIPDPQGKDIGRCGPVPEPKLATQDRAPPPEGPPGGYTDEGTPARVAPAALTGLQVGGPSDGGIGPSPAGSGNASWGGGGAKYPNLLGPDPKSKKDNLPDNNMTAHLTLPTACQVGADGNTLYSPGCRAPTDLGYFTLPTIPKTDGDPSPFSEDYTVFMR